MFKFFGILIKLTNSPTQLLKFWGHRYFRYSRVSRYFLLFFDKVNDQPLCSFLVTPPFLRGAFPSHQNTLQEHLDYGK